ncbi:uncharacterized protein TNCV_27291 [Trichonephila clavipes]|uniref:Uncharacterized protein n=1 Tax=Trichonephila clavipes TaxID=2585209 RepID=A0A8X6WJY9_TRICX|nr:uncharacterized protein TNCV_27291 [Trichonephila clavipes]
MVPAWNRRGALLSFRDGNPFQAKESTTSFHEEDTHNHALLRIRTHSITGQVIYPPYWSQVSPTDGSRLIRNKSVQWADWELQDVMEFNAEIKTETVIDESSQTELEISDKHDTISLLNSLVQTSVEISELASQSSRSPSLITCTTFEEDDERQAALQDLISHLEDTAALLRDYLLPPKSESFSSSNISSFEQTTFLLKYQIVLVLFTQVVGWNEIQRKKFSYEKSCGELVIA